MFSQLYMFPLFAVMLAGTVPFVQVTRLAEIEAT